MENVLLWIQILYRSDVPQYGWTEASITKELHLALAFRSSYIWLSQLASCLIYARAFLEYVIFTLCVRSVNKMLSSVKFAEVKVLTFLILREKC